MDWKSVVKTWKLILIFSFWGKQCSFHKLHLFTKILAHCVCASLNLKGIYLAIEPVTSLAKICFLCGRFVELWWSNSILLDIFEFSALSHALMPCFRTTFSHNDLHWIQLMAKDVQRLWFRTQVLQIFQSKKCTFGSRFGILVLKSL